MQNSDGMKTGELKSVSENLSVGAENKKRVNVNFQDMMTQSSSRARGGRMDLGDGEVNPIGDSELGTDD